jgi:lysozyme family protein
MAASSYDFALKEVLKSEGGYSNHPSDPGGPTNFGITIADYKRYLKPNATAADVKAMRVEEAKAIYKPKYWDALRCDNLPAGLDYAVFDFGVNSGISRSAKYLQRLVGTTADGVIGPLTLAAVAQHDVGKLIVDFCDARLAFLKSLATWRTFGPGWGPRVARVKQSSLRLHQQKETPMPKSDQATASPLLPPIFQIPPQTPTVQVPVAPISNSRTVYAALVAGAAPIISMLTKGKINIDPGTQDMIAGGISLLAGLLAAKFRNDATSITPAAMLKLQLQQMLQQQMQQRAP